ncbi:MAG TPA: hypothetical protein VGR76_00420 [Candidatus Angelobacter sp.]|jgi:hypothetical protein|nr:hypothetical protein [Candidatus Angelobacter sp.]
MPLPERTPQNFKASLATDKHGFSKVEAYWPNGTSWRNYDYGQARLEATLQRDGSFWLVMAEIPSDGKAVREIMVSVPPEVVEKLKELAGRPRP